MEDMGITQEYYVKEGASPSSGIITNDKWIENLRRHNEKEKRTRESPERIEESRRGTHSQEHQKQAQG